MPNRFVPDGGRYTRPRRGFRAKSNYRRRLAARGLTPRDVRMSSLNAMRSRQGTVPGSADSIGSAGRTNPKTRRAYSGVQMPRGMREMASDDTETFWGKIEEVE